MMALMKAMTKNAPVIKNVLERLLIVLGVVASKILNYFFFKCIPHFKLNFSYCVPKDFCNKSEDCKGDYEVCVHAGGRYEGKCVGLRNRRDKINCDL